MTGGNESFCVTRSVIGDSQDSETAYVAVQAKHAHCLGPFKAQVASVMSS